MSMNPPTFQPPVLAVGAASSPNGRQQLGSGLVTHRGVMESNAFRANGWLNPQSGRGTEVGFQNAAPYGYIQVIDRDTTTWLDLQVTAKNIYVSPQAGGRVSLPAGTAQQLLGSYRQMPNWAIPAINVWYETPVLLTATCTGGLIRLEACGSVYHTGVGGLIYVGFMLDGTSVIFDSLTIAQNSAANQLMGYSIVAYHQTPAGIHRWAVCLYSGTATGNLWNGAYQNLWVTEQRA